MGNGLLLLLSIVVSGLEPFLPIGSMVLGWAAVVGTRKHDAWGMGAVLLAGLVGDVLLVSRLGISSAIALVVWLVASLASSRLDRPLLIAALAVTVGQVGLTALTHAGFINGILVDLSIVFLLNAVWSWILERQTGIRLREST